MVEQDDAESVFERGRDQAPHVLVAAKAVSENDRRLAMAADADVVTHQRIGHQGSRISFITGS